MTVLPPDFKEFLELLNKHKVEYLLIGGYAVSYYGYPRYTGDIDIWINKRIKNAKKIVDVIREFGFDVPDLSYESFTRENIIRRMGNPPLRIDILTSIDGVDFDECFKLKIIAEVDGIKVNFISCNKLKENKKATGRLQDMSDLENLP